MIFLIGFVIGLIGFITSFVMYLKSSKEISLSQDEVNNPEEVVYGDITFTSIDSSVYVKNAIPTLDKFGIMNEPFSFSIKNNVRESKRYTLLLVDNNSTIKNKYIRYELTKNNEVMGIYTLTDDGVIDIGEIKSFEEINYSIKFWLDYNSDIKVGSFSKKISVSTDNLSKEIEFVNEPILADGMIPVYYDSSTYSWHKSNDNNSYKNEWYNYEEQKWANAVTVDSAKREEYMNSPVGTKIDSDDINAYWVWIPRFSVSGDKDNINITFVDSDKEAYAAFKFNNQELNGFWISKFESGMKEDSDCANSSLKKYCNDVNNKLYYVPNYIFVNRMTMANQFYAIRKMELSGNIYGFKSKATKLNNDGTIKGDNNNIDTHMIKNVEWQAVALLSSSKYGKTGNNKYDNKNKMIVNNSSLYTGKALIDDTEYDYNVADKGESASTTGNVYGVYDMSGGRREYVMINNEKINIFSKKSNSGFSTPVKEYYYDNDFSANDTTLAYQNKYSEDNLISSEPITRGGYKNTGNIFNVYCAQDYLDKISLESNSRATLVVIKEK